MLGSTLSSSTKAVSGREKRRIAAFTGNRADYAPLVPVLTELRRAPDIDVGLIVAGTHLSPSFGLTGVQIVEEGLVIAAEIETLVASDTPVGVLKSLGLVVIGLADALARWRPDIFVVLGDRYEVLGAAVAATLSRVPVAHIAGGDITEGAVDDSLRHAITKLSHLHFPAYDAHGRRIIQMGERPEHVHVVGSTSVDAVGQTRLLDRLATLEALGLPDVRPILVVTYHPVTAHVGDADTGITQLLAALEQYAHAMIVFTAPNPDAGGRGIEAAIAQFVRTHPRNTRLYAALGPLRYMSLVRHADLVVGNSSSGLVEAPALRTPTVNVGDRQRGRIRAASVIDAPEHAADIATAIRIGLSRTFRERTTETLPTDRGGAAVRIVDVLRTVDVSGLLAKRFREIEAFDVPSGVGRATAPTEESELHGVTEM
jgi:UDP-N-acetylglucosamine 2-epimerase (non-hydrolysing)/GDP/UDP-N,N'-diacetylbacillosamine 2-epimerase (hydrolysing)